MVFRFVLSCLWLSFSFLVGSYKITEHNRFGFRTARIWFNAILKVLISRCSIISKFSKTCVEAFVVVLGSLTPCFWSFQTSLNINSKQQSINSLETPNSATHKAISVSFIPPHPQTMISYWSPKGALSYIRCHAQPRWFDRATSLQRRRGACFVFSSSSRKQSW